MRRLDLVTMQDLRLRLDFQLAQLVFQARDRAREFTQVELHRTQLLLDPGAGDADLAGAIEQLVQQLGIHARQLRSIGLDGRLTTRRHQRRRQRCHGCYRCHRRLRCLRHGKHRLLRRLLHRFLPRFLHRLGHGQGHFRDRDLDLDHRQRAQQAIRGPEAVSQHQLRQRNRLNFRHDLLHRLSNPLWRRLRKHFSNRLRPRRGLGLGVALAQRLHARHQRLGSAHAAAIGQQVTHPCQLVQRRLQHTVRFGIPGHQAHFHLRDQRFQLVGQIAHRGDAGHARATLEGVQRTLQRRDIGQLAGLRSQRGQYGLRGLEQLRGLVAENRSNLGIVVKGFRWQHPAGRITRRLVRSDTLVQGRLCPLDALTQHVMGQEKAGVLIQMAADALHGRHAIAQQGQVLVQQAHATVEGLAQPVIQRLRQADALARLGHSRAAGQRMAGAIHRLRQGMRGRLTGSPRQIVAYSGHMAVCFAGIDVTQHGIGFRIRCSLGTDLRLRGELRFRLRLRLRLYQHRHAAGGQHIRRTTRRQRMRVGHDRGQIGRGCRAMGQLLHQLRQAAHGVTQSQEHHGRAAHRLVEQAIQQALDRPGELGHLARTDHAAAALERMEGTAQVDERIGIERILVPERELLLDARHFLAGLLQIQGLELRICRLQHGGRDRHRINDRMDAGNGRRRARCRLGRRGNALCPLVRTRQIGRGQRQRLGLRRAGVHGIQRGIGIVEHVPRVGAAGLQRLHVVLDADDGIGQALQRHGRQTAARLQQQSQARRDAVQALRRAGLVQHQQAGLDAAHEFGPVVETSHVHRAADTLRDVFLHARQVGHAFAQHRGLHLLEIDIDLLCASVQAARQDHANQLLVQVVLDADERGGDIHQH